MKQTGAAVGALRWCLVTWASCSSTIRGDRRDSAAPLPLGGVDIAFERRGAALNLWEQRISETGEPQHPAQAGSDYWYRLRNNSPEIIRFRTASMYLDRQLKDWYLLQDGRRMSTLGEGREILIMFGLADRKGRPIPYGGDVIYESTLEPGRSILFSVPVGAFRHHQQVFIDFQTVDPDTWSAREAPIYRSHVSLPQ